MMNIKLAILYCRSNIIWKRQIFSCSKMLKNYYNELGISPSASQAEIKNSYYELSKLCHPDIAENKEENVQKFREISEAYDVLGNVKSRKLYDKGAFIKGRIDRKSGDHQNEGASNKKVKQNMSYTNIKAAENVDSWLKQRVSIEFDSSRNVKIDKIITAENNFEQNSNFGLSIVFMIAGGILFFLYLILEIRDQRKV